ncbi:MAG: hypothetical protein F9K24_02665 [Leptonema illini]|uniref:Uncharacterized protein n=1 Tax=Leptonema illini TaxID=183 RepID=A0A833H450_9LEPT|nr:MAG: hypothetical protein F9K24_02665 [Leptonema illini]
MARELQLQATPENRLIHSVDETLHSWMDYIRYCMDSDFYREARRDGISRQDSAVLTLLWTYLSTFSLRDRERIENDVDSFYFYAKGFLNELSPFRYNRGGYDPTMRAVFMGKIRAVLKDVKAAALHEEGRETYEFLCAIVRYTSSEDYICRAYDLYRRYLFRFRPKVQRPRVDFQI